MHASMMQPSAADRATEFTAVDGTGAIIGEATLPDGTKIYTDSSWKVGAYGGNISDPGFDDTSWPNATSYGGYGVSPWNALISGMSGTSGKWIWSDANKAELVPIQISASTASSEAYPSTNAWDNNSGSCWSSGGNAGPASTEWIRLDLGSARDVRGVSLTPRQDIPGACFPVDFAIQTSLDGTSFTTVSGQNYIGYPNPGAGTQEFRFVDPVRARYVRIYATTLSATGGTYYCQLAEVAVKDIEFAPTWIAATALPIAAVSASSTYPGYSPAAACDGNIGTTWSSAGHTTEASTEYITFDVGSPQSVGAVVLNPIYNGHYFPKDFSIQYSSDGVTWAVVPGQSYTNYPAQMSCVDLRFAFANAVQARYIRINATKLTGDGSGYYFQLNEAKICMANFTAFASSETTPWGVASNVTDKDSWDS